MDWSELIDLTNDTVTATVGEPAVYRTKAGIEKTISVMFKRQTVELRAGQTVSAVGMRPTAFVVLKDLPAIPGRGDRLTIRGETFQFDESQEDGFGGALLILKAGG